MNSEFENQKEESNTGNLAPQTKNKNLLDSFELLWSFLGLLLILSPFLIFNQKTPNIHPAKTASVAEALVINPFDNIEIEALAAYVLDINSSEVLFEKNSEVQLPLASLNKIMTALTALSAIPDSTMITIDKRDLELEGDSGLYADEKWRLDDLLMLTLIESSNDGAIAVASSVGAIDSAEPDREQATGHFVEMMNELAVKLEMSQTKFFNPTGLDITPSISGGYGSARDIARLLVYAVKNYPDIFRNTKYPSLKLRSASELNHTAENTNKALNGIPVIITSKTGYTELAGGNLAIVFEAGPGNPVAVVVLGSTLDGRFEDVKKLAWAAIDRISEIASQNLNENKNSTQNDNN